MLTFQKFTHYSWHYQVMGTSHQCLSAKRSPHSNLNHAANGCSKADGDQCPSAKKVSLVYFLHKIVLYAIHVLSQVVK